MSHREHFHVWSVRLQAIFWHTLLRRPWHPDATERIFAWQQSVSQSIRAAGIGQESRARRFPFRFVTTLGARIVVTCSPYVRSKRFSPLLP